MECSHCGALAVEAGAGAAGEDVCTACGVVSTRDSIVNSVEFAETGGGGRYVIPVDGWAGRLGRQPTCPPAQPAVPLPRATLRTVLAASTAP